MTTPPPLPQQNPLLAEIHSHVQSMSPGAQAAIKQAIPTTGISTPPDGGAVRTNDAPPIQDPQAHPPVPAMQASAQPQTESPHVASTILPPPTPGAAPTGSMQAPPPIAGPQRGTIPGEEAETQRLISSGSGISQIHNPVGRGFAEAGNILGHTLVPGLMKQIPGTQEHHQQLIGQSESNTAGLQNLRGADTKDDMEAAQTGELGARTGLLQEQSAAFPEEQAQKEKLQDAQITNLLHPQAKTDFEAWRQQNPTAPVEDWLKANGAPAREQAAELRHESLAQQAQLAGQSNDIRREGMAQNAELRRESMAQTAALSGNRLGAADKKEVFKSFAPAMDAADRFNTMTQNAIDAHKGNQQAMLSLLTNHIGMTLGAQKGARITKDILHEAAESQPWLANIGAHFDSNGLLSGVTLGKEQINQMVGLAQQRYGTAVGRARSEAKYMGADDDGPERTPSPATISYYKSLTNGDGQKAKELAAKDGWDVTPRSAK